MHNFNISTQELNQDTPQRILEREIQDLFQNSRKRQEELLMSQTAFFDSEKKNYSLYCHLNNKNFKKYIGITGSRNVKDRWGRGGSCYKNSCYFYNAIQKYGWDNFSHLVLLKNLSKEEAELLEESLIREYHLTEHDRGYNILSKGTLAQKDLIWITNGEICSRIRQGDPIPPGFRRGRKFSSKLYTNGTTGKRIKEGEEIPEGFYEGVSPRPKGLRMCITDGKHIKYIRKEEAIPEGWRRGQSSSMIFTKGKVLVNNGKDYKFVKKEDIFLLGEEWNLGKTEKSSEGKIFIHNEYGFCEISEELEIPRGWKKGKGLIERRVLSPVKRKKESCLNKKAINNGESTKWIPQDQEIPEGWERGLLRTSSGPEKGSIWISNGEKSTFLKAGESIPPGWHKGRK